MLLEKMVVFPISPGQGKLPQLPHLRLQLVEKVALFQVGKMAVLLVFPLVTLCVLQGRILIIEGPLSLEGGGRLGTVLPRPGRRSRGGEKAVCLA